MSVRYLGRFNEKGIDLCITAHSLKSSEPWWCSRTLMSINAHEVCELCSSEKSHDGYLRKARSKALTKKTWQHPLMIPFAYILCTYQSGWPQKFVTEEMMDLQIEHHCFPRLSSWYYPAIQRAVMECCQDHGVKYKCYPDLWSNLRATWRYMRTVGCVSMMQLDAFWLWI